VKAKLEFSMHQKRRRISMAFLIIGMSFLAIGIATDIKVFSIAAIVFVLISLITGGRWLRPRRK
jgi:hypothetical protein